MQPIQYLPQVQPFGLREGLAIGGTIRDTRQRSDAADIAEQQRLQSEKLKQEYSADIQNYFKNPTPTEAAKLSVKYPQQREAFKQASGMIGDEQKQGEIKVTGQIYSALLNGKPEIASSILSERIQIRKDNGENIDDLIQLKQNMENDPKNAQAYAGMYLSSVVDPDKFVETYGKLGEEKRKAESNPLEIKKQNLELKAKAVDLGLKSPQINKVLAKSKYLDKETKELLLELEAKRNEQGIIEDPKDKFELEQKTRKEWVRRNADMESANSNYEKLSIAAKDNSGPGDIALITSFMKMLDPGSVVRETEFSTAQNTAGLFDTLTNKLTQLQDGTLLGLDGKERNKFVTLAKKYKDAAANESKKIKSAYDNSIKTYGLNADNIYGTQEIEEDNTEQPQIETTLPQGATKQQDGSVVFPDGSVYRP